MWGVERAMSRAIFVAGSLFLFREREKDESLRSNYRKNATQEARQGLILVDPRI